MRPFSLAICFVLLLPCATQAQSVQEQWQQFYQQSWQSQPLSVTQSQLSDSPLEVLLESARYPDFRRFSWQDIEQLYQVAKTCQHPAKPRARLATAVEFELALCNNQPLSLHWFASHEPLHPAGGSYADRYLAHYPTLVPGSALVRYLTIGHKQHPLHAQLASLSSLGRDSLLNGYRAWMEGNTLWLSGEQGWKTIDAAHWQPLAKQLKLDLHAQNCTFRYNNLCMAPIEASARWLTLLVSALIAAVTFLLVKSLYTRRQHSREKRFVLQLLTHELRTPITSLGLTVELFREQFDQLSPHTQDTVWRLMSDHQRLTQLTENSKVYLSARRSEPLLKQTASLDDWLSHIAEKHGLSYQLNDDRELALPFYWLTICLDNLINNARQHGKGPISLKAEVAETLRIEVRDGGEFPSSLTRWLRRFQPQSDTNNMGIGLSIVAHLMSMMGGRLRLLRHPTRCILELPL
ncbi:ATP-binding protein [Vibrio fluvialis]|uniref:ATP-binding protein n=1 Tax=Vibrio fluvialis TaxID=676 RepID=UPI0029B02706|nr:DUF3404 domain-containing protein [Vibrio fluvialis]ELV8552603.1 DUF3404 domain-containing protein [Vibrio fluvialis]MDZ5514757.1 DUF3404 domain-containing protein [Vibrio fluvialis]